ncbi:MAG: hypothetical protein J6Q89_07180 [Clostridia bacterium]|nr:hypothetical protein [Clostridia bacterium]
MNKVEKNNGDYYTIDLLHIAKTLWKKVWVIIISAFLCAAIGFSVAAFIVAPKYSSSIMLYVNNSSLSLGSGTLSISPSELTAAQSLAKTYIVILKNRTSLNQVIEKSGVSYTYEELDKMISATTVNETEVLKITVTSTDPYEAATIVNCIAEVLPARISEIIEGSSMEVVDVGIVDDKKISPSATKFTVVGFVLGALLSALILVVFALLDDTVHDDDYILQNYNYPILAKVPYLLGGDDGSTYGYYVKRPKVNK